MERSTHRSPVTGTVLTLALLAGALVGLTSAPAGAEIPYPDTERISVDNAVDAGIAVSQRLYDADAAGAVVLTREDKFPDGLAASALAGEKDAPILFTPTNRLAAKTRAEIDRVLADGGTVYLMGGTVALSEAIEDELDAAGYFTPRISGEDRNATAALTARFFVKAGPGNTALLVRGRGSAGNDSTQGWPDAISCGGFAANTHTPVLLTNPNRDALPASTVQALQELNIAEVSICGGTAAVPSSHAAQLSSMGIRVARFAGATRVTTAIDVARRLWQKGASTDGDHFILINGYRENFFYGIAAAPLSGDTSAPLLIVDTNEPDAWPVDCRNLPSRSAATACYLNGDGNDRVGSLTLLGSTSVVTDVVFAAAAKAAGLPEDDNPPSVPANVEATDTPEDDGTQISVTWDASTDDTSGDITYRIYVRESSEDEFTPSSATLAGTVKNATSFTVTGRTAGTGYQTAVTATDQFGNTSELSARASATPTDEVPATPENAPNVANQPGPAVVVSWLAGPEADVASYEVERATEGSLTGNCDEEVVGGAEYEVIAQIDGRSTTSYRDEDVTAGEDLCYRYRKVDTTGNESGASPAAAITVNEVSGDQTAPAGTPGFYAVNYDQQEGLIGTATGASRTNTSQNRFDVVVPAGAFVEGEGGKVLLYFDGDNRQEEGFVATGGEQIVSVPFTFDIDESSVELEASLADVDGNESPRSPAWSLQIDRNAPNTPRIALVDGVNTDPVDFVDQRVPIVGGDMPRVNPRPTIEVAGLSTTTPNAQILRLYHQGVAVYSQCYDHEEPNPISGDDPGKDVPSNGRAVVDGIEMVTGTNNLVASITSKSRCGSSDDIGRSGDSNTAKYVFNASSFGVTDSFPRAGGFDIDAYSDTDEQVFSVTFNKPAAAGSTLSLRPEGGGVIASASLGAASDTIELSQPDPGFSAGSWELVVDARAADDGTQTSDEVIPFEAGFVHFTSVSAAVDVNTDEPNWDDTGTTTNPDREDGELTLVVASTAPTGRYELFDAETGDSLGFADHTAGTESRATNQTATPAAYDEDDGGFEWEYTGCVPGSSDASERCGSAANTATPTPPQPDGTLPNPLTSAQIDQLGLREASGTSFRFDGAGDLASRSYDWELVFRPASLGGSDTFRAPPQVIRTVDGNAGLVDNAAVRGGWTVFHYVRDLDSGNESELVRDGAFRSLSNIRPTNGLGNSEGQLEAGDSLVLEFGGASFSGTLSDDGTIDGGVQIFAGSGTSQEQIEPHFEAGATASSASRDFTNASRIVISFGSAATVGGATLPQPVDPPTSVHGGSSVIGLNWAVDETSGHAVLLPDSSAPRTNSDVTF